MLSIQNARYLGSYRIALEFNDGRSGVVDLKEWLEKTPLKPFHVLLDEESFSKFHVDDTIVWENGLDLAPEFLFFKAFEKDPKLQKLFDEWGYIKSHDDAA